MNSSGVTSTEKDDKLRCENNSNQTTNNLENDDMHKNSDKENVLLNLSSNEEYTIVDQYNLRSNLKRKQLENSYTELPQPKLLKIDTDGTDFSRVKDECSSNELEQNDDQKLEKVTNHIHTRHRKLYRLLKEGEDITRGLEAKSPNSTITVAHHVAFGSNGGSSKYISTCSNLSDARKLRGLKTKRRRYRNGRTDIVEIDTSKLPLYVKIIDLTESHLRKKHEIGNGELTITRFHKYAEEFSEVLLEGKVPSECLTMT